VIGRGDDIADIDRRLLSASLSAILSPARSATVKTYLITRPIGAVLLKDPLIATTLPSRSKIKVFGPSKRIEGSVEVECNDHRYAVFQHDLDEFGETIRSAGE
jgi:hypothetical protein